MKSKELLFELIHSLTKSEKRYFKVFTSSHKEVNNYVKLFNAIHDQKKYNEDALAVYQQALPDYEVIPIEATIQTNAGGAINCSSKEIPDATNNCCRNPNEVYAR